MFTKKAYAVQRDGHILVDSIGSSEEVAMRRWLGLIGFPAPEGAGGMAIRERFDKYAMPIMVSVVPVTVRPNA